MLRALGLLGCARNGTLSFAPSQLDATLPEQPSCLVCDTWAGITSADETDDADEEHTRAFTFRPLKGFREAASRILDPDAVADPVRLAFLKALTRILRHSAPNSAALELVSDAMLQPVWAELAASTRGVRLAAGYALLTLVTGFDVFLTGFVWSRNVILAIVQAHQASGTSTTFVANLCNMLDGFLEHSRPAVIETTLITVERLARCVCAVSVALPC